MKTLLGTTTAATLLAAGLLAPVHADPPKPDFANLPAYIQALNQSTDPQAIAIRQEIADGPADLAKARAVAQAAGIPLTVAAPNVPANQNAALLYDQWRQELKQSGKPGLPEYAEVLTDRNAYTPEQIARVQQFFDDNRAAMALLHQAVVKPALVFSPDSPFWNHYADLREAAREITTESFLLALDGSAAGAVADQAHGFTIAKQIASNPSSINYLVARAVEELTLSGMRNILMFIGPNAAVDAQAQQTVQDALPVLSLKAALIGDVAISLSEIEKLRTASPEDFAMFVIQNRNQISPELPKAFTPEQQAFVNDLLDAVEAQYLAQMQKLINAFNTPNGPVVFAALPSSTEQASDNPIDALNPIDELSHFYEEVYNPQERIAAHIHADEQVTMAAAAILAAKVQTGAFPDALPGDFPDPFSGKPLGYRREGDNGFVVYSVGPNSTFTGGAPGQAVSTPGNPSPVFFRYPGPNPQPVPAEMLK